MGPLPMRLGRLRRYDDRQVQRSARPLTVVVVPDHPYGAARVDDQHFRLVLVAVLVAGHRVAPSPERRRRRQLVPGRPPGLRAVTTAVAVHLDRGRRHRAVAVVHGRNDASRV